MAGGGDTQVHGPAGVAHDPDRVVDVSPIARIEGVQVVLDASDQLPQSGDLGVGGHRLQAGPFLHVGGGAQPFPVGQQGVEVVA